MSDKRKRGDDSSQTDDIVQAALREQQEAKKAKKQPGCVVEHPSDKGMTLSDIEEEEGGVIKESQVAMAHAKRTQKRKTRKGTREGNHHRYSSVTLEISLEPSLTIGRLMWQEG